MAFQDVGVKAVVQGLSQYMKDLDKINVKTSSVGKAVVGALAGTVLGGAVGILGSRFAKLDQTMAGVQARAGLTATQTDKLTDSVIKLSKSNLQSQDEIAGTAEALISLQGVSADNQQQIDSLTQSYLDYAQVTGQTAPDAVHAFDDILDAWNLTATDAQGIMDALVVSHQKFGTDVVGAQGALNKYASTFQTLGLDVNDALGYINLFAASGVDAESASTAFTKAVGLLTDGTDASNKKLADMAANLGLTNDQLTAFKNGDPAAQFDILTNAIAATEDPTIRAQAAIDLFGAKAGPKMAEALAGNGIKDFKINMDDAAGASATAADVINSTITNKLKLLGNEILGRAQELTQSLGPALVLLGNPQITSALGAVAGGLASLKLPDGLIDSLKGLPGLIAGGANSLAGGIGSVAGGVGNVVQTVVQTVSRTPAVVKALVDDLADKVQNITQQITKIDLTPAAQTQAEAAGKNAGTKFGDKFSTAASSVIGTALGAGLFEWVKHISWESFAALMGRGLSVALPVAIIAALSVGLFLALKELGADAKLALAIVGAVLLAGAAAALIVVSLPVWVTIAAAVAIALAVALGAMLVKHFWQEISGFFGDTLPGLITDAVTSFFTPENIGARLADVVAIALTGLFAVPILLVHFRQPIADMFQMIGQLIIDGATALPGLLVDAVLDIAAFTDAAGHKYIEIRDAIYDGIFQALSTEIPGLGLKIGEVIAVALGVGVVIAAAQGKFVPLRDAIYEFFGTTVPEAIADAATAIGDAVVTFFSVTLPDLLTREAFFALLDTMRTFFGATLPEAITVEMPKIPGAVIDGLAGLPDQVLTVLTLVTDTVTGWVGSLADWLGTGFVPWDWISAAAGAFVDEIVGWLELIWGSGIISDWVSNLSTWLTENFTPWEWVKTAFDTLVTSVTTAIDGLATTLKTSGTAALLALRNGMIDAVPAILLWLITLPETIAGKTLGWVTDLAGKFLSAGYNAAKGFAEGVVKGIPDFVAGAVEKIADAADPRNWYSTPEEHYRKLFREAVEGISDEFHKGADGVGGAAQEVATKIGAVFGNNDWPAIGHTAGDAVAKGFHAAIGNTDFKGDGARAGQDYADGFKSTAPTPTNPVHNPDGSITLPGGGQGIVPPSTIGDAFNPPRITRRDIMAGWDDAAQAAQDALARIAAGTATAQDALILLKGGFADIAQAVIQYNLGLITLADLQAIANGTVSDGAAAVAAALANYDLLDAMLAKAKDKHIDLTDALSFEAAGFTDLALAVEQYDAGIITADQLTQQIQTSFTAVATSAAVLGAQWTTAFADSMARQDLLEKVGSAGVRVIDQLNLVLAEGGQKNVAALADMVVQMEAALNSNLPADQAALLGGELTTALQTAITSGTPDAIQAVIDLLTGMDDAIANGTTEVLSSVDKFKGLLSGKFSDKALEDEVGKNGMNLLDALQQAIDTGGAKGEEAMASTAFTIIEALNKNLLPSQAKTYGDKLMAALNGALTTGGAEAVQMVTDLLAQIDKLLNPAPAPTPGKPNPNAAPPTYGPPPPAISPATNLNEMLWQKSALSISDLNKLGTWSKVLGHFIPMLSGMFVNMNLTSFHDFLKTQGLAFAGGGFFTANKPTVFLAGEGTHAEDVSITRHGASAAELLAAAGSGSKVGMRSDMTTMNVQVNAPINLQFNLVDWGEVKRCVNEAIDGALGRARSETVRGGVLPQMGVG